MDEAQFIDAGLYDPQAAGAADRLAMLRYVFESGATLGQMVEANRDGNLTSLVTDLELSRGELSAVELAERSGAPLDEVIDTYRLLGLSVTDTTERLFDEEEVRLLEMMAVAAATLPEGVTGEILRAIGAGLAIVADSAVSAFVGSFEDELEEQGSLLHRAQVTTATGELGIELGVMMGPLFRHHLRSAITRQRAAMAEVSDRLDSRLTVGFVDLVGFTAATASMDSAELLAFIRAFHSRTYDVVTCAGGRVVKHIGDEIMFTAADPAAGCEIALALIDAFGETGSLPRGGLSHGTLISRHGDYYGTRVNLAARLVDIAVPGEVLADASVAELLPEGRFDVEPAGRRVLKGFAEPVAVISVRPCGQVGEARRA